MSCLGACVLPWRIARTVDFVERRLRRLDVDADRLKQEQDFLAPDAHLRGQLFDSDLSHQPSITPERSSLLPAGASARFFAGCFARVFGRRLGFLLGSSASSSAAAGSGPRPRRRARPRGSSPRSSRRCPGSPTSSAALLSSRSASVAIPASASRSAVFSPMPGISATAVCRRREAWSMRVSASRDLALDLGLALDLDLHPDERGGEPDVLSLLADRERELVVLDDAVEAHRRRPRGGSGRRA